MAQVLEGSQVSHYRILRHLSSGGMGDVYIGEDQQLRRQVAIKFIRAADAADVPTRRRFEREAQAASALNHPNICTVFEIDEHDGHPFLVLRLLEADAKRNFCVYPAVDNDHMFDKIRNTPEFQAARQNAIACKQRFASYARLRID